MSVIFPDEISLSHNWHPGVQEQISQHWFYVDTLLPSWELTNNGTADSTDIKRNVYVLAGGGFVRFQIKFTSNWNAAGSWLLIKIDGIVEADIFGAAPSLGVYHDSESVLGTIFITEGEHEIKFAFVEPAASTSGVAATIIQGSITNSIGDTGPIAIDIGFNSQTPTYYRMVTGEIGIASFGDGVPVTGEIVIYTAGQVAPCTGEIGLDDIPPPSNPLGVNLNHGAIAVCWGHPEPLRVSHYEVYAGFSALGPFYPYPTGVSGSLFCMLSNFPIGTTAYLKVRAVAWDGRVSSFATVKRGLLQAIEGLLQVTAIAGTTVQVGTTFSQIDRRSGLMISFRAKEDFTV